MDKYTGTVIQGTLRLEDLIPAFWEELERRNSEDMYRITEEFGDKVEFFIKNCSQNESSEAMYYLAFEVLPDALDKVAPEGMYFGAHPGDLSDFGFWPIEENILL